MHIFKIKKKDKKYTLYCKRYLLEFLRFFNNFFYLYSELSAYQNSTSNQYKSLKTKIFENYVYCKRNFWFISKLIRTFYNNIKKYDFMIEIRDKKIKNLK
jgi:hypothetical protein